MKKDELFCLSFFVCTSPVSRIMLAQDVPDYLMRKIEMKNEKMRKVLK